MPNDYSMRDISAVTNEAVLELSKQEIPIKYTPSARTTARFMTLPRDDLV